VEYAPGERPVFLSGGGAFEVVDCAERGEDHSSAVARLEVSERCQREGNHQQRVPGTADMRTRHQGGDDRTEDEPDGAAEETSAAAASPDVRYVSASHIASN